MRILFIHPFLYRYARGIERYLLSLAPALAQKGVEVEILTWRWPDPLPITSTNGDVLIRTLPTSRYFAHWAIVPFYVAHLLTHRYDMVLLHFAGYGEAEAIALAKRLRSFPYGIVFHYPYSEVPHRYREFRRYGLAERATRLIAVSDFVAEEVHAHFGRECAVISHGVDTERFFPDQDAREETRRTLGIPPDCHVLLTMAALEERKGIQWVLRALPEVLRAFPDVVYLVIGEGQYGVELRSLATTLGLDDRVCFLGAQMDVPHYYQVADLSIILSRGEASSLFALESLACQVPVIAAWRRPFDELICPEWGLMVNERDEREVVQAICHLLANRALCRRMGKAGRAHILVHHTWDKVAERYLEVLD
jgi:glycosyltransferase involved in cell wall biosynthesis